MTAPARSVSGLLIILFVATLLVFGCSGDNSTGNNRYLQSISDRDTIGDGEPSSDTSGWTYDSSGYIDTIFGDDGTPDSTVYIDSSAFVDTTIDDVWDPDTSIVIDTTGDTTMWPDTTVIIDTTDDITDDGTFWPDTVFNPSDT